MPECAPQFAPTCSLPFSSPSFTRRLPRRTRLDHLSFWSASSHLRDLSNRRNWQHEFSTQERLFIQDATRFISMALTREQQIAALEKDWAENPRWKGVTRAYSAADVVRLRGSVQPEHTLARMGAEKLWNLVTQGAKPSFRPEKDFVNCMGALTGGQAVQQVKAGIQAIY